MTGAAQIEPSDVEACFEDVQSGRVEPQRGAAACAWKGNLAEFSTRTKHQQEGDAEEDDPRDVGPRHLCEKVVERRYPAQVKDESEGRPKENPFP